MEEVLKVLGRERQEAASVPKAMPCFLAYTNKNRSLSLSDMKISSIHLEGTIRAVLILFPFSPVRTGASSAVYLQTQQTDRDTP